MKFVLIQGNMIAQYEGRKQGAVLQVGGWNPEWDAREFIEDFRLNGEKALA